MKRWRTENLMDQRREAGLDPLTGREPWATVRCARCGRRLRLYEAEQLPGAPGTWVCVDREWCEWR